MRRDVVRGAEFASLSIKDLLAARDQYHFHLMNKANVIGTAIGRYLIRKSDPWPTSRGTAHAEGEASPSAKEPRTFESSEVREYSWPCVLVLVDDWVASIGTGQNELHPEDLVPRTLYLADGRVVPVCVVLVKPAPLKPPIPRWLWPTGKLGPGMPLLIEHQNQQHVASVGCLVSDGHTTYALTNRHVSGSPGQPVYVWRRGGKSRVGHTSQKQITRLPFSDVYPDYSARRTFVNLDVGLVEVEDLNEWTSDVFNLGPVGEVVDLHEANLGLDLIEASVVAHGATSGDLSGRVKGLFYRYKSVGGWDYVAEFLIAPTGGTSTQEGDSGTVWHLQRSDRAAKARLLPLAVAWGAQAVTSEDAGDYDFSLATSLTSVCRQLDVEVVAAQDVGAGPTWGQLGHYSIGAFAIDAIANDDLKRLMQANLDRVSFATLDPKAIKAAISDARNDAGGFVPLADVPDIVWKATPNKMAGGRDRPAGIRSTGPEHPTHYADIDEPRPGTDETLRAMCIKDDANVSVAVWQAFYDECGHKESNERGLLPFRVWQFFDAMVDALRANDVDRFVCAAGIVSHYVGDACQPLHGSMYADGYKERRTTVTRSHRDGSSEDVESNVGAGVHAAYETNMIDRKRADLVAKLPGRVMEREKDVTPMATGKAVAIEVVKLMDRTAHTLPPIKLVDAFVQAGGTATVDVYDALWTAFERETIDVMADGAQVLAAIWDSAWKKAKDAGIKITDLAPREFDALRELYQNPKFVESLDLDHIESVLK